MIINYILHSDAPENWRIYFQDSASPTFEGIVELHDSIMFYLIIILIGVTYTLIIIVNNFNNLNNKISYKYLNHGKLNVVPIHKSFNIINNSSLSLSLPLLNKNSYSTLSVINPIKSYINIFDMKPIILKDNINKSGIYLLTNKLTNDSYIGQSKNITNRLINYFNLGYLRNNKYIISRAIIKYGYYNFSLKILEYCNISELTLREQYYLDKLTPTYNILKVAGKSIGFKHSKETKCKISKSLNKYYKKNKSILLGRTASETTKKLMRLKKIGINNNLFGKKHTEITKELMRQKALGRLHSEDTKFKMSQNNKNSNPINIYEKLYSDEFKLIGNFISARRAGKFLGISGSMIIRYKNSGKLYKERYKFK